MFRAGANRKLYPVTARAVRPNRGNEKKRTNLCSVTWYDWQRRGSQASYTGRISASAPGISADPNLKEVPLRLTKLILFGMLTLSAVGCGNENSLANAIADPTGQLPAHVSWNSYNLYSFTPALAGSVGSWHKVISLGQVVDTLPAPGANPVLFTHGLGGSIKSSDFAPLAQYLFDNNLASSAIGFEYDSEDGVTKNGTFLTTAMQTVVGPTSSPATWAMIGHSMGGLVVRSAIESSQLPIAATSNRVITMGTPHLGAPVVNAIQSTTSLPEQVVVIAGLDQEGGFTNADGNPSQVDLNSPGFSDLRTDSPVIAALNANVANNQDEVIYYTIAGTRRDGLQAIDDLLGVQADDGLVNVDSANWVGLGAAASGTAPKDHLELTSDEVTVFPLVRTYLTQTF
jgi:hypothetical protein